MPPTNWLIITGHCGAIAYGIILLGIIILTFMPVKSPDEAGEEGVKKKKLNGLIIGPGVAVIGDGIDPFKAEKEEKAKQAAEGAGPPRDPGVLLGRRLDSLHSVYLLLHHRHSLWGPHHLWGRQGPEHGIATAGGMTSILALSRSTGWPSC